MRAVKSGASAELCDRSAWAWDGMLSRLECPQSAPLWTQAALVSQLGHLLLVDPGQATSLPCASVSNSLGELCHRVVKISQS